jgi:hypothetical protein
MTTVKKKLRSAKDLSTLDDFLTEEGTRETFQAVAVKDVLAWQIEEAMKTQGFTHSFPRQFQFGIRRFLRLFDKTVQRDQPPL